MEVTNNQLERCTAPETVTEIVNTVDGETNQETHPLKRQGSKDCKRQNSASSIGSGTERMNSVDDEFECDCDSCLLGFDDTRPGEVLEQPKTIKVKRSAV